MTGVRITGLPLPAPAEGGAPTAAAPTIALRWTDRLAAGFTRLTGIVDARTAGGGALRIVTELGPIVIRPPTSLAPGTPVVVTLHREGRNLTVHVAPAPAGSDSPHPSMTGTGGPSPALAAAPRQPGPGVAPPAIGAPPAAPASPAAGPTPAIAAPAAAPPAPPQTGSGGERAPADAAAPVRTILPVPRTAGLPAMPIGEPGDGITAPATASALTSTAIDEAVALGPAGATPAVTSPIPPPAVLASLARSLAALLAAAVADPQRPGSDRTAAGAAPPLPARGLAALLLALVATARSNSDGVASRSAGRTPHAASAATTMPAEGWGDADAWQVLPLPAADATALPLVIFERHRPGGNDSECPAQAKESDDGDDGVSRVVFDCRFGRLGRLQLDTLFRRPHHLDVIIRSEQPLPAALREAVRASFAGAAAPAGLTGGLAFQAAPADWVEPAAPVRRDAGLRLMV